MTHDRSHLSQLLQWCAFALTVCARVCGGENKALYNYWMRWIFELIAEARLSQQLDQCLYKCSCVGLIQQLNWSVQCTH